jgi:hypothetical protein
MDYENKIAVIKAVATLFERWQLTIGQKIAILGFESEADLRIFVNSASSADLTPVLEQRLSLILSIHERLRLLFSNPTNIYGYMTMVNNNSPFDGQRPIEVALRNLDGLNIVYKALTLIDSIYEI